MVATIGFGGNKTDRSVQEKFEFELRLLPDGRWKWDPGIVWAKSDAGKFASRALKLHGSQLLGLLFPFGIPDPPKDPERRKTMESVIGWLTGGKPLTDRERTIQANTIDQYTPDSMLSKLLDNGVCDTCKLANPADLERFRKWCEDGMDWEAGKAIKLIVTQVSVAELRPM